MRTRSSAQRTSAYEVTVGRTCIAHRERRMLVHTWHASKLCEHREQWRADGGSSNMYNRSNICRGGCSRCQISSSAWLADVERRAHCRNPALCPSSLLGGG